MNSAIERLLTLRVADVMCKEVVTVSHHDTMPQAARRLVEHSISGAPVVDDQQRCTGVLSASDYVRQQGCACGRANQLLKQGGNGRALEIEDCSDDLVCHHMTPGVRSIAASQSLLTAARMMCAEHVHRLPVLDDRGCPLGMVTALDVVASLVNAIDE